MRREELVRTSFGHVIIRGNLPFASLVPLTMASIILGWSEPRFTKQWVIPASQIASKNANDAVYMLSGSVAMVDEVDIRLVVGLSKIEGPAVKTAIGLERLQMAF